MTKARKFKLKATAQVLSSAVKEKTAKWNKLGKEQSFL